MPDSKRGYVYKTNKDRLVFDARDVVAYLGTDDLTMPEVRVELDREWMGSGERNVTFILTQEAARVLSFQLFVAAEGSDIYHSKELTDRLSATFRDYLAERMVKG